MVRPSISQGLTKYISLRIRYVLKTRHSEQENYKTQNHSRPFPLAGCQVPIYPDSFKSIKFWPRQSYTLDMIIDGLEYSIKRLQNINTGMLCRRLSKWSFLSGLTCTPHKKAYCSIGKNRKATIFILLRHKFRQWMLAVIGRLLKSVGCWGSILYLCRGSHLKSPFSEKIWRMSANVNGIERHGQWIKKKFRPKM